MNNNKLVVMAEFSDVRYDARVLKEAKHLAGMGFQVILFMYDSSSRINYIHKSDRIIYNILGNYGWSKNTTWLRLFTKYLTAFQLWINISFSILTTKAIVYHAHNLKFMLPSYIATKIHRASLIYDAHELHSSHHDNSSRSGRMKNKLNEYFERAILPSCTAFIQASRERADYIAKKYNIPVPFVVNNYVPLQPIAPDNQKLRRELDLDNNPILFYSGGIYLNGGRRLDNVLEAIRAVDNINLVIIGFMSDSVKSELQNIVLKYKLTGSVHFLPPQKHEQLHAYACSSDMGIIPLAGSSINTKLSALNKVSEYLMAGLPILCSNYSNLNDIIFSNNIGTVGDTFDVKSPASIAAAMNLIHDSENIATMKKNAYKLACSNYYWENETNTISKIYENI
jgi:glycosyltransferase involved in cell wall biosynthesis